MPGRGERLPVVAYRVPWAGLALAREGVRHPRVLVGEVPDGNANAGRDGIARRNDVLEVGLLLREQRRGSGERHADVELGDGDLDAGRGERLELRLEVRRDLADDEVALEADTVEWDACGLERLDEVEQRGRLGAGVLNIILVDVELGGGVGSARGLESNADVGLAEGVVEDIRAPCAVIVEGL